MTEGRQGRRWVCGATGLVVLLLVVRPSAQAPGPARPARTVDVHYIDLSGEPRPCGELQLPEVEAYLDSLPPAEANRLSNIRNQFRMGLSRQAELGREASARVRVAQARIAAIVRTPDVRSAPELALMSDLTAYYIAMWRLADHEEAQRALARDYAHGTAPLLDLLPPDRRRQEVLAHVNRLNCLRRARLSAHESVLSARRGLSEALDLARGARLWVGGMFSPDDVIEEKARRTSQFLRYLDHHGRYTWLSGETGVQAALASVAMEAHAQALERGPVHDWRLANTRASRAAVPVVGGVDGAGRDAVVEAVRTRLQRLRMALIQKEAMAEAALEQSFSIVSGLSRALSEARRRGLVISKDFTVDQLDAVGVPAAASAVLAIGYRVLADSLAVLVMTPLQNTIIDRLISPLASLGGRTVRNSHDRAVAAHQAAMRELGTRLTTVDALVELDADGLVSLVDDLRGRSPIPVVAGGDPRLGALLDDADLIASSQGGITAALSPLCGDVRCLGQLLLHGAVREVEANTRLGLARVAAERGFSALAADSAVTEETVDRTLAGLSSRDGLMGLFDMSIRVVWRLTIGLPRTVQNAANAWYGNLEAQHSYLRDRETWPDRLRFIRLGLEAATVDFDFDRLARRLPDLYRDHETLVARAPEYAAVIRRMTAFGLDEERRRAVIAKGGGDASPSDPAATAALVGAQAAANVTLSTLAVREAYGRLVFHALTANHAAAAGQARSLEQLERIRLDALGRSEAVSPDIESAARTFDANGVRQELVAVYEGLYHSAVQDVVVSMASLRLTESVNSAVAHYFGVRSLYQEMPQSAVELLYGKLNPWRGKLTQAGVYATLQGAFGEAVRSSTTQVLSQWQRQWNGTTFTDAELDRIVDVVFDVLNDTTKHTTPILKQANRIWALDLVDAEVARTRVDELRGRIDAYDRRLIEPEQREIARIQAAAEAPDADDVTRIRLSVVVPQIQARILELKNAPEVRALRAELALIGQRADEAAEREAALRQEAVRLIARLSAVDQAAAARDRLVRLPETDRAGRDASLRQVEAADFVAKLAGPHVTAADLARLVDPADPLRLSARVFGKGLSIDLVRGALKAARANAVADEAVVVKGIAEQIDDRRISIINDTLAEFMRTRPELAASVVAVIQGGAAKGNPEYRGVDGDIDFTVFLRPGASVTDQQLRQDLMAFFRNRGFPLAGDDEAAMDAEVFAQPWGRFDSAVREFGDVISDVVTKRRDPTRFYSEAGSKWFINSVAYSGLLLWAPGGSRPVTDWVRIRPGEAYGLALDMARYLPFLTDPHYRPAAIAALPDDASRQKALGGLLDKSKYFIRLIDAYLISHAGVGNALYNDRLRYRAATGEDASYHLQIAKDVERLGRATGSGSASIFHVTETIDVGGRRVTFTSDDHVRMVRWMALMKMKGDFPNPWQVPGLGATDAERVQNALTLATWMQHMGPKMFAHAAAVAERDAADAMVGGDPGRRQEVRADAQRIVTTILNAHDLDAYGSLPLMQPPVAFDSGGRERPMTPAEHEAALRIGIERARSIRERVDGHAAVIASMRRDFERQLARPPTKAELGELEQRILEAHQRSGLAAAQVMEEEAVLPWIRRLLNR